MLYSEYKTQIAKWQQEYNVKPAITYTYNPSQVKLGCARCKRIRVRTNRHHKANDFMFAMLLPNVYAARYVQFLPEDIDKLCEKCHKYWHKKIGLTRNMILKTISAMKVANVPLTKDICEAWRKIMLDEYEKWKSKPIPKRKKKNGKRKRKRNKRVHD